MFGTKHRRAAQELLQMLRGYKFPEIVCQYRAADVDCIIDSAAALVGEDKVSVSMNRGNNGCFYSLEVKIPVTLSSNFDLQFGQHISFKGGLSIIYECGQSGFTVRSSVREYDLGVYRSLAPMHGAIVRKGLSERYLLNTTPYTASYMDGAYGLSLFGCVLADLSKGKKINVSGINSNPERPQLRDAKAMQKAERR